MKKIALFVVIMIIGSAVFAAAPKKVSKPVVVEEIIVTPVKSTPKVTVGNQRVGVQTLANPGGLGSIITFGTRISPNLFGDLGIAVAQNAAGANTNVGVLLRLEFDTPKVAGLKTHAGGNLTYASNPAYAAAATASLTLNIFAGIEHELTNNFSVFADITALEVTSSGSNTSFGLGAGTAGGTGLGAVAGNLYCGARIYL